MQIASLIAKAKQPFFSLEFFPPSEPEQLVPFYTTVERLKTLSPLFVSVTYGAGGAKQQNTLAVTAELAMRGFNVMAHLTCVGAESNGIRQFLEQLRQAHVENVLALRGDAPRQTVWDWHKGEFQHASDLVAFVKKHQAEMGIGVAAYPTPHPESPSFEMDRSHLAAKIHAGADFAVTQIFFDAREYEALVRDLRGRGITVPVIPGILPIQSFESLKRVLSLCGASIPGKLYLDLEAADRSGGADALREAGLAFAIHQIRQLLDCGAPGIHLYTLNKADLCLKIASAIDFGH